MKKRVANAFLKISKVISIICIPFGALLLALGIWAAIDGMSNAVTEEDGFMIVSGVSIYVLGVIIAVLGVVLLVFGILSLIFVNLSRKNLAVAKTKKQMVKPAIYAIIAGVFIGFSIVSAVMMFTMKQADFDEKVIDVASKDLPEENINN